MSLPRSAGGGAPSATARQVARRLPQLLAGLWIFGMGLGFVVLGGQGQGPWVVWDEGVSLHTPLTIGTVAILTGLALVAGLICAREPIGFGTLMNALVVGLSTDVTLALFDQPASVFGQVALTLVSPWLVALGSGLYLGVMLGPGPRDGVMTALHRRGVPIWLARFIIEAVPFTIGAILGGTVGWGTVYWLLVIGPAVNLGMKFFSWPRVPSRWIDVFNALGTHGHSVSRANRRRPGFPSP
ncbi:MAG: hypothetical protein F4Z00_10885 [Acidimicrobiaceae bacterium]|nr:hypothetical protein [Acidimicrobiaceae bacterium]MXZ66038.1 hypothetical protein [Acidimicrobiaceae bacterium]MYF34999.1 hypothetical protein [Acidimicrobiaceae bacterium]MYG79074.1 hypothetical protein [Acidimicrobiaceae bacterium]MYJ28416.1 hypothetical protein [Acidimicrobiaceae bacterium]